MRKLITVFVVILVMVVIALAALNCPFLKSRIPAGSCVASWLRLPCIVDGGQDLAMKRGELYSRDGMWHIPYDILSRDRVVFSGEIISEDVIAPYLVGVKNGNVLIRYKGADLSPRREAEPEPQPEPASEQ